jgi:hypothetical protein
MMQHHNAWPDQAGFDCLQQTESHRNNAGFTLKCYMVTIRPVGNNFEPKPEGDAKMIDEAALFLCIFSQ